MEESTLIELGILAVLVYVVSHPATPQVTITNVIPPPQQRSGGDNSIISDIANGVGTLLKLL